MSKARRLPTLAGSLVLGPLVVLALALGLAQTAPAKAWLAAALGRALSADERVTIGRIRGFVPFDLGVDRIEIADTQGPRIVIDQAALAIAPLDLLRGRLTVRRLTASLVAIERLAPGGSTGPAGLPAAPLAISVEHLAIARLTLGRGLVGEPIAAALAASLRLERGRATADLDLERSDGTPGEAHLHVALAGAPIHLALTGTIAEPSGRLLAGLLGQARPLPLALRLDGDGPLADWHGSLAASAGDDAGVEAEFRLLGEPGYRLSATGTAALAPLLPPALKALAGQRLRFSGTVAVNGDDLVLEALTASAAALTLSAQGRFDRHANALAGEARLALPELAVLAPLVGADSAGAALITLSLGGQPTALEGRLTLAAEHLAVAGTRAARANATVDLRARGDPFAAASALTIAASGDLEDIAPAEITLPAGVGERVGWRLHARLDRQAPLLAIDELVLADADSEFSARAAADGNGIAGEAALAIPAISRFSGDAAAGALQLDAVFRGAADGSAVVASSGALRRPRTGQFALDRLLGDEARLSATIERLADGTLSAREVNLEGADARLGAAAQRGGDGRISGTYRLDLPRLAALDPTLAGSAALTGNLSGGPGAWSAGAELSGDRLALGPAHLDRLAAHLEVADLAAPAGHLEIRFSGDGLDGTASAEVALQGGTRLRLARLMLEAARTRLEGELALDLARAMIDGRLTGTAPDLKPWSGLAGTPLAGSAELRASFGAGTAQSAEVTLDAAALMLGGDAGIGVQRLQASARIADAKGKPSGRFALQLDHAQLGALRLTSLGLSGDSNRPGQFALSGSARGEIGAGVALAAGATLSLDRRRLELSLTRLSGTFAELSLALQRPLSATLNGDDLTLADLDLAIGGGRLTGAASAKGDRLSLRLKAERLPVDKLARLWGEPEVGGELGFEAMLSGTRARPEGRLVVDGEGLRFAVAPRPDLPTLGLVAAANLSAGVLRIEGRLAGPHDAALGVTGTLPVTLDARRWVLQVPPSGAVQFHLEGDGELANFAELMPIGEDRLAGHFTVDVSVGGSVAAPVARGRLSLRAGSYESLFWGTSLSGVSFDLVGDRQRLVLHDFTAGDGAAGGLTLAGAIDLGAAAGPAFDIAGRFAGFRALQRDEATARVSGSVSLSGNLAAPRLSARLSVDEAELRVPERLPQMVQPIAVTLIDSATGQVLATPDATRASALLLALALDVAIDLPGQVFVRGRGLDSEWRGRLAVTGTSAAPALAGKLEVVRGTYDFLGKTAALSRGTLTFLTGKRIDPEINIEARAGSIDVIAIVQITGTARQPKLQLSSQPDLPQDEILARVLFGTSLSRISAAQAVQIAQAAAGFATGGDPGVLDRIRRGLGLDRLALGSPSLSSPFNSIALPSTPAGVPSAFPTAGIGSSPVPVGAVSGSTSPAAGAAVSAGKYVADGVYVGVSQGAAAGSSSVDVQIDVTPHLSIDTTAGQSSGTGLGIGLNWKLDY